MKTYAYQMEFVMLEQDSFFKPFVIVMRDILDQGAMVRF